MTRAASFVVLACALSWAWWIPLAASGTVVGPGHGWPTHLIGLMGPAVAAVVVTAVFDGRRGLRQLGGRVVRWRVGRRWYGVVVLTALLALIPLVTASDAGAGDFLRYSGAPDAGWWTVGYVLVVNGFGEEIGWRGFLVEHLVARTSPGRAASVVWAIWGIWHLPLFWIAADFRDFGVAGTVGWTIGLGFGSVFLAWLYLAAGHSILIVALWHTAYNFATATDAANGLAQALATSAVVVAGVVILRRPATWQLPERPVVDAHV